MRKFKVIYILSAVVVSLLCVSCYKDTQYQNDDQSQPFADGEQISFGSYITLGEATKALVRDDDLLAKFSAPAVEREFVIEMYKKDGATDVKVGESRTYKTGASFPADGALVPKDKPLRWQDSQTKYAFKATSGSATLSADQSTEEKFNLQDKMTGYGYEALVDKSTSSKLDNINGLNYHTSKEWYQYNKTSYGAGGTSANWKTVPLFFQRDRCLLTIILKAGKGVDRHALNFANHGTSLTETIYAYNSSLTGTAITPYATEEFISYGADETYPAQDSVSTTRYDAIVEPFEYYTNYNLPIIDINLSSQKYSYHTRNDDRFYDASKAEEMKCYNVEAGEHLILLVKLEADNRIMVISAQVQPWNEISTHTVVDDFGLTGDPIVIPNRDSLISFLTEPEKNKTGVTGVVAAPEIDLLDWDPADYTLKASLNLAGATLLTTSQFLSEIEEGGTLLNGLIFAKSGSSLKSVVCGENNGTINSIDVNTTKGVPAIVSVAGLTEVNNGKIYNCTSSVPLNATGTTYAGGIAAVSSSTAAISGCTVTKKVKGDLGVIAGGIVGNAGGSVFDNKFEYGITLSQPETYKNIIGSGLAGLDADSNSWPTTDLNDVAGVNVCIDKYNGIIDCEEDMTHSLLAEHNTLGLRHRVVDDLSLSDSWTGSDKTVNYSLYGDNNTIALTGTTNAKRIYKEIHSTVRDLIIDVQQNITTEEVALTSATASLAYYLCSGGVLNNVRVKVADGKYIEAANPAGIVVWAYDNAYIYNCQFKGHIKVRLPMDLVDGQCYAGGIVSMAADATVSKCVCHTAAPFSRADDGFTDVNKSIYYGGIVGGSYVYNPSHVPGLLITDCTSNFSFESSVSEQNGAVIGYAQYYADGLQHNGLLKECQGNWWTGGVVPISTKGVISGKTAVEVIGKCNAVKPTLDSSW